ncbi:GTPase activating protein [Rhizoclosmatium sp. JEL0117]|nr:GTPase activating protein [Rhizoclosmatium sp. JEL0117]
MQRFLSTSYSYLSKTIRTSAIRSIPQASFSSTTATASSSSSQTTSTSTTTYPAFNQNIHPYHPQQSSSTAQLATDPTLLHKRITSETALLRQELIQIYKLSFSDVHPLQTTQPSTRLAAVIAWLTGTPKERLTFSESCDHLENLVESKEEAWEKLGAEWAGARIDSINGQIRAWNVGAGAGNAMEMLDVQAEMDRAAFDDGIIDYEPARVYLAKWSHDLQVARSREFVEAAELDAITRTDSFETNTEKDFSFVDEREALSLAASTLGESGRLVMRKNDATSTSSTKQKKLGVWDETTLAETQIGAFVVLSTDTTPPPPKVSRLPPLSPAEWRLWFDEYVPVPAALPRPRNHLLTTEDSYYIQDEISDSDREDVVDLGVGNGRIVAAQSEIQRRIFVGGVDPELRGQVWPFLFELYPWDSTHAERKKIKAKNTAEYWRMKYEWLAVAERLGHQDFETTPSDEVGQDPDADMYRDASMRVDKDVPRTDRGHPFYNDPNPPTPRPPGVGPFSPHQNILRDILITYACSYPDSDGIGYVQGQSDLLSPILIICNGDEVDAFYIFANLMSSKKQNFLTSGTGMHNHLQTISRLLQVTDPIFHSHLSTKLEGGNFFFTFRWFLVSFKREFSFQDTCTLWEVVQTRWAAGGVNDFLYFVALAILDEHRDAIMRYLWTFDELLKYINDLAGVIPINSTLEAAELLYLRFRVRAASLGVLPVLAAEEEPSSAKNRGKAKKKKEEMPSVASELGLMEILDLIVAKEAEAREDVKGAGKRKTA